MKKFYKIAKRNVRTTKAYQEITRAEFEELVMNSDLAEARYFKLTEEELEDEDKLDETTNEIFEEAERQAKEYGFDAGDYHIYIGDESFNMWEISRR
jgi:hypothetical protein